MSISNAMLPLCPVPASALLIMDILHTIALSMSFFSLGVMLLSRKAAIAFFRDRAFSP